MHRRDFLSRVALATVALKADAVARVRQASSRLDAASPEAAAADEDFWFHVRDAFTIDRNQIFLNSGSVSPAPRIVQEAMDQYLTITNMSPSLWVDELLVPEREQVRRRLAALFGADAEEIAITRNTSEALEIVQLGLDLEPGDEVLTTTQDYSRMLTTWRQRERRDGIVLRTFPVPTPPDDPAELTALFEAHVTDRTRVIHLSHVTYTAGQIFPVGAICEMARARGIETIVDGAHSFAQFPFTVADLQCDYFGTSLHKWLTAPVGTGFLYVRREKIAPLWPLMAAPPALDEDIRKFEEIGTHPVAIVNAVGEAIKFHESIGPARKAARLRYLRSRWMDRVRRLSGVRLYTGATQDHACALGTMGIDGIGAGTLTDHLQDRYGIHVRPRFVPDEWEGIRITPNVFTTLSEIDAFAEAIEQTVRDGAGA